jgi:hypothetical protein
MTDVSVFQALNAVMRDVQAVGKDSVNRQQDFRFRGVDAVVNAVGPKLREHGVVVAPEVISETVGVGEYGKNRTKMREVMLKVRFRFYGPAGDFVDAVVWGEANDSGDKATAKAHSVAFRTALLQVLCIPTDEPDPDEQVYERSVTVELDPVTREEIRSMINGMDPERVKVFKAWWKTQRLPALERLSEEQAAAVVAKLYQMAETDDAEYPQTDGDV